MVSDTAAAESLRMPLQRMPLQRMPLQRMPLQPTWCPTLQPLRAYSLLRVPLQRVRLQPTRTCRQWRLHCTNCPRYID
jgi:hypothetical protein